MLRNSGMMDDRDYQTYMELFNNMANFMRKPNLVSTTKYSNKYTHHCHQIIHLDVKPEESMRRIKSR